MEFHVRNLPLEAKTNMITVLSDEDSRALGGCLNREDRG